MKRKVNPLFDIDSIESKESVSIEIFHPVTGKLIGASIEVYGSTSKVFKDTLRAQHKQRLELAAQGLEAKEDDLELFVACTKSWKGFTRQGMDYPCTEANVRELYTKQPWIREQVDKAIVNKKLFFIG